MLKRTALLGLKAVSTALLLAAAGRALADTAYMVGYVDRVLITGSDTYGGCMVDLTVNPADILNSCASTYLSFSCSGDFTDRVSAYRMLDAAQLALATGKRVRAYFRDDMKHNGYCYAYRIDVLNY